MEFDTINWTWEWVPAVIFGTPLLVSMFISCILIPYSYCLILKEMYRPIRRLLNVFRRK